jgi:hypothetical protein
MTTCQSTVRATVAVRDHDSMSDACAGRRVSSKSIGEAVPIGSRCKTQLCFLVVVCVFSPPSTVPKLDGPRPTEGRVFSLTLYLWGSGIRPTPEALSTQFRYVPAL